MTTLLKKHADELRDLWQSRALRESNGKTRRVVLVALAKEYPEALVTLLKVTFPGFVDIGRPMFLSYAWIDEGGRVVATMIERDGTKADVVVYENEGAFIYDLRKLADRLKLPDGERVEMFRVLQKWVTSDKRINLHGERKLAS